MLNFTVGPVQSSECVRAIGAENVPYFRTPEFSNLMLENERMILDFANAPEGSRAIFLTGSGTAAMEAAVMNALTRADKALVVNGGSFGTRFVQLLQRHDIPYDEIKLERGQPLREEDLARYEGGDYTTFLINACETSTGVKYDMDIVAQFCKRNNAFLIVDAISYFLAEEFDMTELDAGIMITGSQKALACPPGISILALAPSALEKIASTSVKCMYFDLKDALKNGERGQTPFTPAVATLIQIHERLKEIEALGGAQEESRRIGALARYFRNALVDLPFELATASPCASVTSLHPTTASAYDIFTTLKDEYEIWVCPNGGELRDLVFRVGHIGALTTDDYDVLLDAFRDMQRRALI